jgi:hypothetical protein
MNSPFRFVLAVVLLFTMPVTSQAQSFGPNGPIGPDGVAIVLAIAGVAAGIAVIAYLSLHKPAILGCVQSIDGSPSLIDEKDKHAYALAGDHSNLKVGERFKLKGKKITEKDGKFTFRVKSVDHDYGVRSQ